MKRMYMSVFIIVSLLFPYTCVRAQKGEGGWFSWENKWLLLPLVSALSAGALWWYFRGSKRGGPPPSKSQPAPAKSEPIIPVSSIPKSPHLREMTLKVKALNEKIELEIKRREWQEEGENLKNLRFGSDLRPRGIVRKILAGIKEASLSFRVFFNDSALSDQDKEQSLMLKDLFYKLAQERWKEYLDSIKSMPFYQKLECGEGGKFLDIAEKLSLKLSNVIGNSEINKPLGEILLSLEHMCEQLKICIDQLVSGIRDLKIVSSDGETITIPAALVRTSETLKEALKESTEGFEEGIPSGYSRNIFDNILALLEKVKEGEDPSKFFDAWLSGLKEMPVEEIIQTLSALIYYDVDLGSEEYKKNHYFSMILFIFEHASEKKPARDDALWKNLTKSEILEIVEKLRAGGIDRSHMQDLRWLFREKKVFKGIMHAKSDKENFVLISDDKTLTTWNLVTGKEEYKQPLDAENEIKWACVSDNGKLRIINFKTGSKSERCEAWYADSRVWHGDSKFDKDIKRAIPFIISDTGAFFVAGEKLLSLEVIEEKDLAPQVKTCIIHFLYKIFDSLTFMIKDEKSSFLVRQAGRFTNVIYLNGLYQHILNDFGCISDSDAASEEKINSLFRSFKARFTHAFGTIFLSKGRKFGITKKSEDDDYELYNVAKLAEPSDIPPEKRIDNAFISKLPLLSDEKTGKEIGLLADGFEVSESGGVALIPTKDNRLVVWHIAKNKTFIVPLSAAIREDIRFSLSPAGDRFITFYSFIGNIHDSNTGRIVSRFERKAAPREVKWLADRSLVAVRYQTRPTKPPVFLAFRREDRTPSIIQIVSVGTGAVLTKVGSGDNHTEMGSKKMYEWTDEWMDLELAYAKDLVHTYIYSPFNF